MYARKHVIEISTLIAKFLFMLLLGLLVADPSQAQTNASPKAPSGWTKSTSSGKHPNVAFAHNKIKSPDYLVVKFYDRQVLVDQTIPQWIEKRLITGSAPLDGKWSGPIENMTRQTGNLYTAQRKFTVKGKPHSIDVTAVCVDKLHVRMAATIRSLTPETKKHDVAASRLRIQVLSLEIEAAKKEKRGLAIEKTPPKVKGIKPGREIKPGRYVGSAVSRRDNKTGTRYDLVLFTNGQYEIIGKKRNNVGEFVYSAATGRMQIDKPFVNSTYNWDTDFCIYGTDSKGNKVIHAQTNSWLYQLKWVKESDRESPADVERQKAIAKAEAARFKHVTDVGKGVQAKEIEAIIYSTDSQFRSGALQLDQEGYLLLKNGRVRDGLPCSPDTLDLPASLSREPDAWGWWRKSKDDKDGRYEFAWPVRPKDYRMPRGSQQNGFPIAKGTKFSGDFGSASTSGSMISGYSSVRWWGIKFSRNGRFLKYRRGSTQSGGVPGMSTLATTVWDDEGAVTAISGPVIAGGIKSKKNNPAADRMGKYEFDGYRLTLTFDSGKVEHHATFTDEKKKSVWFEGHTLAKREPKTKK